MADLWIVDKAHYGGISKTGATEESQHDFDFENGNAPRPGAVYDRLTKVSVLRIFISPATPVRQTDPDV